MRIESLFKFFAKAMRQAGAVPLAALLGLTYNGPSAALTTTTTLADTPVFASANVPGNMLFDMSVEYPTAISVANLGNYSDSRRPAARLPDRAATSTPPPLPPAPTATPAPGNGAAIS
jgi:hypothetical protein